MKALEEFTEEEIRTTFLVLQAIDIEAESFFNSECAGEFHERIKLSESDISTQSPLSAPDASQDTPSPLN